jgi:hypothetical protein
MTSPAGRDVQHGRYYCVAGKVNGAGPVYLVVESVKPDSKHGLRNSIDGSADSAEGSAM